MEELDIHPDEVSHTDPGYEAVDDDGFADELEGDSSPTVTGSSADEGDLDDWSEGLYRVVGPNGEFSVLRADSKRDALVQLDKWAGAELEWLVPLETFMADFRLDDEGALQGKLRGVPRLRHLAMGRRKVVRREWLQQWLEAGKTE